MKKISLQWRLTIMLAALMTVSCLLLNLLISRSAVMRIDEVERYIMEIEPASQDFFVIDVDNSELLTQYAKPNIRSEFKALTLRLSSSFLAGLSHVF